MRRVAASREPLSIPYYKEARHRCFARCVPPLCRIARGESHSRFPICLLQRKRDAYSPREVPRRHKPRRRPTPTTQNLYSARSMATKSPRYMMGRLWRYMVIMLAFVDSSSVTLPKNRCILVRLTQCKKMQAHCRRVGLACYCWEISAETVNAKVAVRG